MSSHRTISIAGRDLDLTHLDKLLFPRSGVTKGHLLEYYQRISKIMLPHVRGRMVTIHRFPEGIHHDGFYQREVGDYFPSWVPRHHTRGVAEPVTSPVIDSTATLLYLVNLGTITPHIWLSRVDSLTKPDRMLFDLDPSRDDIAVVRSVVRILREVLASYQLPCFIQTTGSQGYHVVVPLQRRYTFDQVRSAAGVVADAVVVRTDAATTAVRVKKRHGRVYIDVQRNSFAQSFAAPYSVRPLEGAPVATPIRWDELGSTEPQAYTIKNVFRRLSHTSDPWKDTDRHAARLPAVLL